MGISLFNAIHDGRAERLAQLLLRRALETDDGVRRLFAITADEVGVILEEDEATTHWRTDVKVTWAGGEKLIELKLAAPITRRQHEAIAAGKVDWLVVPSDREQQAQAYGVKILTWRKIGEQVNADGVLRELLLQADGATSWRRAEISEDEVNRDFRAFIEGGPESRWTTIYQFLSTLHETLEAEKPTEAGKPAYRTQGGWSKSRNPRDAFYGYWFAWGDDPRRGARAWLGFEQENGGNIELRVYDGKRDKRKLPLAVEAAAEEVRRFFDR